MSFDSVCATINFAPPTVIKTGEAYAGLGPVHFHFSLPVARSYATRAPFSFPPSCAMTRPSTIIGELDGKKPGHALKSSLRQIFLPSAAPRQEIIPRTPMVTTFPPVTAGELRGPENPPAGPLAPSDSYFSDQSSLPSSTLRQRVISFPSCREKTKSLSPTSAGVATPSPTVTFHFWVSSLGQLCGALKSAALASRLGPRHWGQSWANATPAPRETINVSAAILRFITVFLWLRFATAIEAYE